MRTFTSTSLSTVTSAISSTSTRFTSTSTSASAFTFASTSWPVYIDVYVNVCADVHVCIDDYVHVRALLMHTYVPNPFGPNYKVGVTGKQNYQEGYSALTVPGQCPDSALTVPKDSAQYKFPIETSTCTPKKKNIILN